MTRGIITLLALVACCLHGYAAPPELELSDVSVTINGDDLVLTLHTDHNRRRGRIDQIQIDYHYNGNMYTRYTNRYVLWENIPIGIDVPWDDDIAPGDPVTIVVSLLDKKLKPFASVTVNTTAQAGS